jgi:eukaryotic-like serine/threonine-protein kinase
MAQTITMDNVLEAFDFLLQLGAGSKGQVWLARSPGHPKGPIAVKLLHPPAGTDLSAGGQRWEALGDHPNVVRVFEARWAGAKPYVAMEYVDGPSLRVVLEMSRGRHIPMAVTMHIMRGLLHALAFAHSRSNPEPVVHGALCPDSILIDSQNGTAKLDDFCLGPADGIPDTIRGRVMDRLRHLAPEQLAGRRPTVQTDLYAAGILLHELLLGIGPFEHLPMLSLLSPNTRAQVFAPNNLPTGTPEGLLGILRRALAGSPQDRFSSAVDMLAVLQPYMPPWEDGALQLSRFTRQLARHARVALASVPLPVPAPIAPAPTTQASAWEPKLDGSVADLTPTDRFAAITAVAWTSTYRLVQAEAAVASQQSKR